MSFKENKYPQWMTKTNHNSSPRAFVSCKLKTISAYIEAPFYTEMSLFAIPNCPVFFSFPTVSLRAPGLVFFSCALCVILSPKIQGSDRTIEHGETYVLKHECYIYSGQIRLTGP